MGYNLEKLRFVFEILAFRSKMRKHFVLRIILAIHYYQEDDIKDIKKIPNCHIVVNLSDQTKENLEREAELEYKAQKLAELKAKDAKILENKKRKAEAAKRKDEETGQLSLF